MIFLATGRSLFENLDHLLLDGGEILGRKGALATKNRSTKPFSNHRADVTAHRETAPSPVRQQVRVDCRRISTPLGSRSVTMATSASASIAVVVSTSLPFTFPASAAARQAGADRGCDLGLRWTGPGNDFDEAVWETDIGHRAEDAYYHDDSSLTLAVNPTITCAICGSRASISWFSICHRGRFFSAHEVREWTHPRCRSARWSR